MKERIKDWLLRPFYVWEYTTTRKIVLIILCEIFSVGFKILYQPELIKLPFSTHSMFYIGHGVVNILVLITVLFVFPYIFNGYFKESRRTVLREILWIASLLALLTFSHAVLVVIESNLTVSESIRQSLYVNLKIGVFPIAILMIMASIRSLEIRLLEQELYNSKYLDTSSHNKIITIKGEAETLRLTLGDLYFVKSSNNYSEIHYLKEGVLTKKFLRVPLSNLEKEIESEFLFRIHRSYIINFLNSKKVVGNANRCFVLLKKESGRIPVSRVKRAEMLEALDKLPIQTMV